MARRGGSGERGGELAEARARVVELEDTLHSLQQGETDRGFRGLT
jgi:hypothetical protein